MTIAMLVSLAHADDPIEHSTRSPRAIALCHPLGVEPSGSPMKDEETGRMNNFKFVNRLNLPMKPARR
jgi:hypothetical protein